jgi:hypothetical protein
MALLLPVLSYAADPAASAPALAEEAAECRELLSLCQAVHRRAAVLQEQKAKVERKIAAARQAEQERVATWKKWRQAQGRPSAPPDKTSRGVEAYQRATTKAEQAAREERQAEELHNAEVRRYQERVRAAQEAARTMRAKHTTMPACFERCADVLNLEELR